MNEHQRKMLDVLIGPRTSNEDKKESVEAIPGFRTYGKVLAFGVALFIVIVIIVVASGGGASSTSSGGNGTAAGESRSSLACEEIGSQCSRENLHQGEQEASKEEERIHSEGR